MNLNPAVNTSVAAEAKPRWNKWPCTQRSDLFLILILNPFWIAILIILFWGFFLYKLTVWLVRQQGDGASSHIYIREEETFLLIRKVGAVHWIELWIYSLCLKLAFVYKFVSLLWLSHNQNAFNFNSHYTFYRLYNCNLFY